MRSEAVYNVKSVVDNGFLSKEKVGFDSPEMHRLELRKNRSGLEKIYTENTERKIG